MVKLKRSLITRAWIPLGTLLFAFHLCGQELPKLPQGEFPKPGEGFPKFPAPEADKPNVDAATEQLRQQIAKKLGKVEDGKFVLVFSKAVPATRPANGVLPQGARRLPNNRWLEVIYQVEMTEGQAAAIDMVLLFLEHVKTYPNATYDWGLVARVDDAQAEQTLQAAQAKYVQGSVTLRPLTVESLQFFNRPQAEFFNGPKLKP